MINMLPMQIQTTNSLTSHMSKIMDEKTSESFVNMLQSFVNDQSEMNNITVPNNQMIETVLQHQEISTSELMNSIHSMLTNLSELLPDEYEDLHQIITDVMEGLEWIESEQIGSHLDMILMLDSTTLSNIDLTNFVHKQSEQGNVSNKTSKLNIDLIFKTIQSFVQTLRTFNERTAEELPMIDKLVQQSEKLLVNEKIIRRAFTNIEIVKPNTFTSNHPYANVYVSVKKADENSSTLLASINGIDKATDHTVVTHSSLYHQPGQMKLESLTLQDGHSRPVNFDSFVRQFTTILNKGKLMNSGPLQKLTIQLKPEHLGTLKIELVQQNNELVAKIISSTKAAKELLESQIQGLRHAFIQQNINVTRIDVETHLNQEEQQGFHEHDQPKDHNEREQHPDQKERQNFSETLLETLVNYEV